MSRNSPDTVLDCLNDLKAKVQSIAAEQNFSGVELVLSASDLMDYAMSMARPSVGIMYAGQRSFEIKGNSFPKRSHNIGAASKVSAAIVLITDSKALFGADTKISALAALKAIRDQIMDTTAPNGHFWEFFTEMSAGEEGSVLVWVQNWQVPVILL